MTPTNTEKSMDREKRTNTTGGSGTTVDDDGGPIFCIGDSRTGTTSFHEHAEQLGLASVHHYEFIFRPENGEKPSAAEKREAILTFVRESGYRCFSDYPTRTYYKELAREFPNARFVNTVRSLDTWVASCRRYFGNAGMEVDYDKLVASHVRIEQEIADFFGSSDRYLKINICEDDPASVSTALNMFLLGYDPGFVIGKANQGAQSYFKGVVDQTEWGAPDAERDAATHRLVPPRDQFTLYNHAADTLDELVACISRRKQKAVLSERGHAFLVNDTSRGFEGIVLGRLDRADAILASFRERRRQLAAAGCSYTVFIVPDKVTLAARLLPKCFDPFAAEIAANIATRRLADHVSSRLGYVYDMAPYLDSLNEMTGLLFRYDSHLNYLGSYHLAMAMSEILSSTLPGAIDPIAKDIWSCKVGTWRGDLLEHLPQVETSMLKHVWRRNTNLLAMGPQCKPPNEQFLHYFMRDADRHLTHETDAVLQALHPGRTQLKYSRVRRSAPGSDRTLLFVHDSSIDKIFDPLSMMADDSYFYWNRHLLPPASHPSMRPGTAVVQVIAERFLYA
jgi:hypothetical protein